MRTGTAPCDLLGRCYALEVRGGVREEKATICMITRTSAAAVDSSSSDALHNSNPVRSMTIVCDKPAPMITFVCVRPSHTHGVRRM